MKSVLDLKKQKDNKNKIKMVTCYDHWTAKILGQTEIDCLLVGDSLSMVVHGFDSTVHATLEMMILHTAAVARARTEKLIVSDLPFLAHRKGKKYLMDAADALMKAGAQALKIETQPGQEKWVRYLIDSGVPVVGHVGLTPQYVNQLGGYKVQGKKAEDYQKILKHSLDLEEAGASALVLECVPSPLATEITHDLSIPTIGIGAGLDVDGQVLVLQDLLGMDTQFKPRFVRQFAQGEKWLKDSIDGYTEAVNQGSFPSKEESFQ